VEGLVEQQRANVNGTHRKPRPSKRTGAPVTCC
jgi:hypothetical protein